jgi:hypothetical protein
MTKHGIKFDHRIVIAAAIGFLVPIFWGFLELLFIHVRLSESTLRIWTTTRFITCPFWSTPLSNTQPLVNAALYAAIAFISIKVTRTVGKKSQPPS